MAIFPHRSERLGGTLRTAYLLVCGVTFGGLLSTVALLAAGRTKGGIIGALAVVVPIVLLPEGA